MANTIPDFSKASLDPGSAEESIDTKCDFTMDNDDDASDTVTPHEQSLISEPTDILDMVSLFVE